MSTLLSALGFLTGLCVVPGLAWLLFVWPYSTVSLAKPGAWFFAGVLAGLAALLTVLGWWYYEWPGD